MKPFDTIIVADWSAAKRAPAKPSKDAIWIAIAGQEPCYFRTRITAEAWLRDTLTAERAAGRRVLACFDFPFGYPAGFARQITGSDDPLALWDWFEAQITDAEDGTNNRYEIAERLNALTPGPGPFWGKPRKDRWPGLPYAKAGITFAPVAEKRACDHVAKAASSCFQMNFPPTVGGQVMMGLPTLNRLRRLPGVAVWPFAGWQDADCVLAEIWPGLIEAAVKAHIGTDATSIRDAEQVRLLAHALAALSPDDLHGLMTGLPEAAQEEAWILGAGARDLLTASALTAIRPPKLRNDCFALPPGVHWTPVEDALATLKDRLHPVMPVENVPLEQALGRVLAQDLTALRAHPPTPNSAVDGYGFAHATASTDMALVPGRAAAGVPFGGVVPPGSAVRILTGAPIPQGVDTVVLQEDVVIAHDRLRLERLPKPGANTRAAGEDKTAGAPLLAKGHILRAPDLAALASTGHGALPVHRRLRVGVLSTGDELAAPGAPAAPAQIFDANGPMLRSVVTGWGFEAIDLGRAPDDRAALRKMLDAAATRCDAILTSGGASGGDEDHTSALLTAEGHQTLWRIAVKPGRPLALGVWRGVPVFGLPGNPVAAFVTTLIFARPALSLMAGAGWRAPHVTWLPACFNASKKAGRREFLRARVTPQGVERFVSEGSGRVSGLSWADALVDLPEAAMDVKQGDPVAVLRYADLLSL